MCSSHTTSSKKHRKLRFSMLFCCKNAENGASQNVSQALTHTVTHTRKCADRFKEYQRGGLSPLRYFASFFCLHHLRHEAAHRLCGFVLLLPRSVGVGAESESGVIVAEHTADDFDIHTILQCQGRECMPLRYNYDKPEKPRRIKGFEVFSLVFSSFSKPKNHTEISRIIGGVSLTTNE